jgi:hypothetical protein
MNEINYNETVVIPVLQKKYQELVNNNLILELSLIVEQNKNKDLQIKITELQKKLETTSTNASKKKEIV